MKKLLLTFICLFVFSETRSSEDTIEGKMNCVIKDQVVKDIDEGKVSTFSGIKGELSTGDSFKLSYKFIFPSSFALKTSLLGDIEMLFNLKESTSVFIEKKYQLIEAINRPYQEIFLHQTLILRRNKFSVGYMGETIFKLNRYYKGDWEGAFISLTNLAEQPIQSWNLFFDCKHTSTDNYTKVFESLINSKP